MFRDVGRRGKGTQKAGTVDWKELSLQRENRRRIRFEPRCAVLKAETTKEEEEHG